jgi:hypothetical protein
MNERESKSKQRGCSKVSAEPVKHWSGHMAFSITPKEWKEAQQDKTRTEVIVFDAMANDLLSHLVDYELSPKDGELDCLLQAMQLNNRARLAYVLDLIDKRTMQDLRHIHNIRNKWAHVAKPTFSDEEMKKDVLRLSTVGAKKQTVTEGNYMDFCRDAMIRCAQAMLDSLNKSLSKMQQSQQGVRK